MADYKDLVAQIKQMSQSGMGITGDPNVDKLRAAGKDPNTARNQAGRYYRSRDYELARLMDMLQQGGADIMGSIQGIRPDVTQEDIDLIQKLQQATLTPGLAQISGNAGARGLTGSSIEGVQRGQFAAQTALGSQQQLQNIAFQRAGLDLNRQQMLFNTLVGSVMPQVDTIQASKNRGMQSKQQGQWWKPLLNTAIGAGVGFATGGPAGAAVGGVKGATSDMSNPNYGWAPGANPWDFPEYGWGG